MHFNQAILDLDAISDLYDEGFTHFLFDTAITDSAVSGNSRVAMEPIPSDSLVAVVGGLIVDKSDEYLAMPIGFGLFLHQISDSRKGTVNHSCDPNCSIRGFNRLVSLRDIGAGDEITIDYGCVSIGKGNVMIAKCNCGSPGCRGTIKSDDWTRLPANDLCLYGRHMRNKYFGE